MITAIVTHHLNENDPYLNACVRSLLESLDVDLEILVVSSAENSPESAALPGVTVHHRPDLNNASKKVNWAAKEAKGDYLMLVSDDVIVTKRCALGLMSSLHLMGKQGIVMPLSNGDLGSRFMSILAVRNEKDEVYTYPVKCTLEDIRPFEKAIKDSFPNGGSPLLFPQQWLSFFCVMLTKDAWNKIGDLDERLDFRHNDQDYCLRAVQKSIYPALNANAFALHFGDRTLPKVTTEADLEECTRVFKEKWSA